MTFSPDFIFFFIFWYENGKQPSNPPPPSTFFLFINNNNNNKTVNRVETIGRLIKTEVEGWWRVGHLVEGCHHPPFIKGIPF
jgi:hypothetical protein